MRDMRLARVGLSRLLEFLQKNFRTAGDRPWNGTGVNPERRENPVFRAVTKSGRM